MVSLVSRLVDVPFAFVDVETTGASPDYGDRVIELGIARVEGGRVVARFERLVDPRQRIGAGITALTGISNEMCEGQPIFSAIAREALELMRGAVLVGHNVNFDLGFLRSEFRKSGKDLPAELPGATVLDTVRIARGLLGRGGNGLQRLAARFEVQDEVAHRALADALTTARVFDRLIEPIGGWSGLMLCDVIQRQGGVMKLNAPPKKNQLPLELEEALDRGGPVEMEYIDGTELRSVRVVTPVRIRKDKGEMVLLAWCQMRGAQRTFKLDRIVRLTMMDTESQVSPSGLGPSGGASAGHDLTAEPASAGNSISVEAEGRTIEVKLTEAVPREGKLERAELLRSAIKRASDLHFGGLFPE